MYIFFLEYQVSQNFLTEFVEIVLVRRSGNNSDSHRLIFWEQDLKEYIFNFFRKEVLFDIAQVIFYIAGTPSHFLFLSQRII